MVCLFVWIFMNEIFVLFGMAENRERGRERERFGLLCCDDGGEEKKVGGDQMWKWKKMNGTHCDCE